MFLPYNVYSVEMDCPCLFGIHKNLEKNPEKKEVDLDALTTVFYV